jgi:predicted Zn-dependent protease
MNGFRTIGQLSSQNQTLGIESYFIPFGGKQFAFHGVAPADSFDSSRGVFEQTAQAFNRVTDQSKLNVTPQKVEVRNVSGTKTLQQAFSGFGVPSNQANTLAIMNGMNLNDTVPGGTLIKIVA